MFKLKHAAGKPAGRRQLVCQACEQSPAAFICKADDASLCAACDADIHSANPLARRHQRLPLVHSQVDGDDEFLASEDAHQSTVDEDEAASWLLPHPIKKNSHSMEMLFGDEYLDLDDYGPCQFGDQFGNLQGNRYGVSQKGGGEDSVVPIQDLRGKCQVQDHGFQLGLDYESSNVGYSFGTSVAQNVSLSSMDVGVVPESATNEGSISHQRPAKGTIDLFMGCHVQMPNQLSAEDREARVLRYREKKKNRKFEKTIRYASRKAYAEIRPRIKGRFAKRTDTAGVVGVNQMLAEARMPETSYGIVPSLF